MAKKLNRSPGKGVTASRARERAKPVPTPRQDVQAARDARVSRMRIAEREIASGKFEVYKNAQDALEAVQLVVSNNSTRYDKIPRVLETGKVTVADVRKMNAPKNNKGSNDMRKGGMFISTVDNRKKK